MKIAYKYMLSQFLSAILSLFVILFLIVSMIFFIQLARLSATIEVSMYDFAKLYSFMIPRILVFTLPITFFVAMTSTLYRLSRENETMIYFTLGFSPKKLASFFLKIAAIFSAIMLVISLVFVPYAFSMQNNFVDFKKTQVKLNIKTGEFGQKFMDWMVFVEKENDGHYENIVMYHPVKSPKDREQLIIAQQGKLTRDESGISFKLMQGKVYDFEQNASWRIANFDELVVNTQFDGNINTRRFYEYWNNVFTSNAKAKELSIYTLIALMPLASTLFALSFGIVNFRYEKGFAYFGIAAFVGLYFGALSVFYQPPIISSMIIFLGTFALSAVYFRLKILRRY